MKRDEIPMMIEVMKMATQCDARAYAALWALQRLCFRLNQKGVLDVSDIEQTFDPTAAAKGQAPEYQSLVSDAVRDLRDFALGKTHPKNLQ